MKYFTADLYERFNSADIDAATNAELAWEQALSRYKSRLNRIRKELPDDVRFLADELCLHDAELLQLSKSDTAVLIMARQSNAFFWLEYSLTEPATIDAPRPSSAFSEFAVRWLYDEVDRVGTGRFSHEILLSNGQEIRLVFDSAQVRSGEIHPPGTSQALSLTARIATEGEHLANKILQSKIQGVVEAALREQAEKLRMTIQSAEKSASESGSREGFKWPGTTTKPGSLFTVLSFGGKSKPARRTGSTKPSTGNAVRKSRGN